ncbi:hypothetical protein CHS0354_033969 [Potamilus streckersoni]|uniref:Uncharacterized protein n=1 Tax=Potamilus streckersoni TaxID=2493646 RepID=A0AAE0T8I9_9BIVA|nr:hypothetical protein CHS0354_033969 [Potamilus streckersoni]
MLLKSGICRFLSRRSYVSWRKRKIIVLLFSLLILLVILNRKLLDNLDGPTCLLNGFQLALGIKCYKSNLSHPLFHNFQMKRMIHDLFETKKRVVSQIRSQELICNRPNFDLKHDTVKYAFKKMGKLNCSSEKLFYLTPVGVLKLNKTVLKKRKLKKCKYVGIERVNDDYPAYTEALTKTEEPFDLKIKHDFIRVQCFLATDEEKKEGEKSKQTDDETSHEIQDGINFLKNNGKPKLHAYKMKDVNFKDSLNNSVNDIHSDVQFILREETKRVKQKDKFINNKVMIQAQRFKNFGDVHVLFLNDSQDKKVSVLMDEKENTEYNKDIAQNDDYYHWNMDMSDNLADFDQFFVQVSPKEDILKKAKSRVMGLNVLIFGLDSMSHLAWQRKLPKTYSYLKDSLGSVILNGYNIVGDATTAALIPMLTGKTETELPDVRKKAMGSGPLDQYPLIWKDFRHHGYVTMFAEDEPSIGAFNLRLNGFKNQPTDHYMRQFWQALWDSEIRHESQRYCTGPDPHHKFLLQYVQDFFLKYQSIPKFAFVFGSELTHWDNNPGEFMDEDFRDFLHHMKMLGLLGNTVLIVMADHGARYSRVRKTVQGKMEERLPFMSFLFPDWFKKKYPKQIKNLIQNSNRLATPFDIHETLLDILYLGRERSFNGKNKHGISLLKEIPKNRSCASAHIDIHWCTCLQQIELQTTDTYVMQSANKLIWLINKLLIPVFKFCATLRIKKIMQAYLLVPNEKVLRFTKTEDEDNRVANFSRDINLDVAHLQLTVETAPNNGLYEATVQVNMTKGLYSIAGDISRIDLYGDQPACIQDTYPDLRKYCYCLKGQDKKEKF